MEILSYCLHALAISFSVGAVMLAAWSHLGAETAAREAATKVVEDTRADHLLQMHTLVERAEDLLEVTERKRRRAAAVVSRSNGNAGDGSGSENEPLSREDEKALVVRRLSGEQV